MPYREVPGNLLELDLPAVGHGCNCAGSMAGGIAVDFRRRWPEMYDEYVRRCAAGELSPGGFFRWDADGLVIYNLATQQRPGPDARLDAIDASVRGALADAQRSGIATLGVPKLGAGIGGLAWCDVYGVLRDAGEASSVTLTVVKLPRLVESAAAGRP